MAKRHHNTRTSWEPVAEWYDGWMGKKGSEHHRKLAIPALMRLLDPKPGEKILDIGAGQGVLAPVILSAGAAYTGVDVSPRLLGLARRYHGKRVRFICGDAANLQSISGLREGAFDAAVFLLSIQNIEPLAAALQSAVWTLKEPGRLVILMTHPCFRAPRQSGWGWDPRRKLAYRRIDRYISPFYIPEQIRTSKGVGKTRSFHRPLEMYVNALSECGLAVDRIEEVPAIAVKNQKRMPRKPNPEIPLFLGLHARRLPRID